MRSGCPRPPATSKSAPTSTLAHPDALATRHTTTRMGNTTSSHHRIAASCATAASPICRSASFVGYHQLACRRVKRIPNGSFYTTPTGRHPSYRIAARLIGLTHSLSRGGSRCSDLAARGRRIGA